MHYYTQRAKGLLEDKIPKEEDIISGGPSKIVEGFRDNMRLTVVLCEKMPEHLLCEV